MRFKRKFVSPNQKSTDLQKEAKKGFFVCTKCNVEKPKEETVRKNYYWCKECHRAYSRNRPKRVGYNKLW